MSVLIYILYIQKFELGLGKNLGNILV